MQSQKGSIELVVLGLLAALIVVLAIPLLTNFDEAPDSTTSQNNKTAEQPVSVE